ncbi:MAG: helix-turn-helix transcriptional regulator [Coprobacillus sp.]
MKINDIIREKRISKNLTQEQIAIQLGVSTPAVNKWEKGISFPDITLLPPLARLLDTDLNTLLSFKDDLTNQEIALFLNELSESSNKNNFKEVYDKAINKIREFPNSYTLIYSVATLLDGTLALNNKVNLEEYKDKIEALYEQVLCSDDINLKSQAQAMLISKYINRNEYDKAELLLQDIPDKNYVDKRRIQAKLYIANNKLNDAALIEEEKLLSSINEVQSILLSLMSIAIKDDRLDDAKYIAEVSRKSVEIFDMWEYSKYVAQFELYTKTKDRLGTLKILLPMLKSITKKWDINQSSLYRHIKTKKQDPNFGSMLQKKIIESIHNDESTEFLKDDPELNVITEQFTK